MSFDPLLLSRIRFAFVVSFHTVFPAFTIGRRFQPRQGRLGVIDPSESAAPRGRRPQ